MAATTTPAAQRTLTELESADWGLPPDDAPRHVRAILALRHKPLHLFTTEDLRITIGQDVGLPQLVPLALDVLERDPAAAGEHYPGDLLCNVLRASPAYYQAHAGMRERVRALLDRVPAVLRGMDEIDARTFTEAVEEARRKFEQGGRQ